MDRPSTPHKIGDRVRVNCPSTPYHGMETVVIEDLIYGKSLTMQAMLWVHIVDLRGVIPNIPVAFQPHELIPIYDGNQVVSWESCEWQPKGVTCE